MTWDTLSDAERAMLTRIVLDEARTVLVIETRGLDRLDFHDVSVAVLREIAARSFSAGKEEGA